jgi:Flp pilus assembly protein TadB
MIAPALAGAIIGLGLLVAVRTIRPPRPRLVATLARVDRARMTGTEIPVTDSRQARTAARLAGYADSRGWVTPSVRADLAVLGQRLEELCGNVAVGALACLLAVPLVATPVLLAAHVTLLLPAWLALLGALLGAATPVSRLRRQASDARRASRATLGIYLNLTAMRLAGGSGIAEALHGAAAVGDGPLFAKLRGVLAHARMTGTPLARALDETGRELALADLRELAGAVGLIESSGAQAVTTLRAKAATVRQRELAEVHGQANERSQSLLVAQAALGLGFLIFLGYPALAAVVAA